LPCRQEQNPADIGRQWKLHLKCCFFSTDSTDYQPFRHSLKSFNLSKKQRGPGEMSDHTEIFKHVLQKRIGNTEYRREIVILEEGPFVYSVVQELQVNLIDSTPKTVRPAIPSRLEWICSSKEEATQQALRCLQQSKDDNWLLPPTASSAA